MEFHRLFSLFIILFTGFLSLSQAYNFYVGGKDGWVTNPSENFNHWAQRNRFNINDTLFFKYKKGSDSVLVVNKDDYDKCNTDKPVKKMEDGDSVFKLDRSGPFFFISGNNGTCQQGQKLIVLVLALRIPKSTPPSPIAKPPSPAGQVPAAAPPPQGIAPMSPESPLIKPPVMAPTAAPPLAPMSPESPLIKPPVMAPTAAPPQGIAPMSPSSLIKPPVMAPAGAPQQGFAPMSPSSLIKPPVMAPAGAPQQGFAPMSPSSLIKPPVMAPAGAPQQGFGPMSPSPVVAPPAPGISPASSSPAETPTSTATPPASSATPPGSSATPPASSNNTSGGVEAPGSVASSAPVFLTPSGLLTSTVIFVLSVYF